MSTEKQKWDAKKAWIDLFDSLTPDDLERERREAKGLGPKIVATLKEWLFKIMGFIIAPFGWALMWGLDKIIHVFEDEALPDVETLLNLVKEIPDLPPEMKEALDRILSPQRKWIQAVLVPLGIFTMLAGLIGLGTIGSRKGTQYFSAKFRTTFLREDDAVQALFRGIQTEEEFRENMRRRGYHETEIDAFFEVSHFYPAPADLIRWQAREVFEPAMISRYGLDAEVEGIVREAFYKAGMTDEQINNFWRAHWEHASWMQVIEMLHRGQMTEEEVWDWFRVVEIPPFWRDKLIAIAWNVPTRVDVRRWYDMRTIDEARLREVYEHQGYHGKDLDDYVLWTKVYVAWPDLIARYQKGWLDLDDVRSELVALGMPAERVEEMIETKVKKSGETPPEGEESREFTKSEILDGYRRRMFTEEETRTALNGLNYGPEQVNFFIDREDLKREQTYSKTFVTRYKTLYVEGVMPWPDVAQALSIVGLSEAEISELGPLWEAEKLWKVARPTRADLEKFLKAGIIDEFTYRQGMRAHGFSDEDIDRYLARLAEMPERETEERVAHPSRTDLEKFLEKGIIDNIQYHQGMKILGYSDSYISWYLAEMVPPPERPEEERRRSPTRADLDRFLKEGVIDVSTYQAQMRALDYSERYIAWYLEVIAKKAEEG